MVAASARACRRAEKELHRLAAAMRHASSRRAAPGSTDAKVVSAVAEAAVAVAEASAVVFLGCAATVAMSLLHVVAGCRTDGVRAQVAGEAGRRAGGKESCAGDGGDRTGEARGARGVLLQARVLLLINIHNPL